MILLIGERMNAQWGESQTQWWMERSRNRQLEPLLQLNNDAFKRGTSGRRLGDLGLDRKKTQVLNLLLPSVSIGEWDRDEAFRVASTLAPQIVEAFDRVVLLGHRVAVAFGHDHAEFLTIVKLCSQYATFALIFPHPSGRSHWWNDKDNWNRSSAVLRYFASSSSPASKRAEHSRT